MVATDIRVKAGKFWIITSQYYRASIQKSIAKRLSHPASVLDVFLLLEVIKLTSCV